MSDVTDQDDLTGMTFDEIAARHGEEAAINAGIAADPDTFGLDDEWFERSRPAIEAIPSSSHIPGAAAASRGRRPRSA